MEAAVDIMPHDENDSVGGAVFTLRNSQLGGFRCQQK